ncbi:MAG: hypothetical protein U0326_09015 [Polyangiales bacterium]
MTSSATHPLELWNAADLSGVALDHVKHLRLTDCEPACLAQIPPHIESLTLTTRRPGPPVELDLADGALAALIVSTNPARPIRFTRLPRALRRLQLTGDVNPAEIPATLQELSLWSCTFPTPLRVTAASLRRLVVFDPRTTPEHALAIEALPPALEDLWLSVCTIERLPDPLPPLNILHFGESDLRLVAWDRLPSSLSTLNAYRCLVREPVALTSLAGPTHANFNLCNLTDARDLVANRALSVLYLQGNPLSDETVAAAKASRRGGPKVKVSRPNDLALTRRMYELGIGLSATHDGAKKIRLYHPLGSAIESFPREVVEEAMTCVTAGERLAGMAFIERVQARTNEAKQREREARKAAKQAQKTTS